MKSVKTWVIHRAKPCVSSLLPDGRIKQDHFPAEPVGHKYRHPAAH